MNPFDTLCERIDRRMHELNIPGVAVGIWYEGQEISAAMGVTSIENPLPVTADTLFQIGSITKTMLATSLMRLVEQGQVDLDRPVRAYLPELHLSDEGTAAHVTLRHLLTHTGGWAGDYFNDFGWGDDALKKMVASLKRLPQLTPLGTCWHYNNAGFAIAGRVLEVASGLTFEKAVAHLLFEPVGMAHSFFFPEDVMVKRFVVGHFAAAERAASLALPWAIGRANHPAGGVVSTIPDLLRYARFHLGDGLAESGERLLAPASLVEMRRPQASPGVSADAMGLTWFIKTIGDVTFYRHGGSTHGQNGQLLFAPGKDFAFALLSNAESGDGLGMEMFPAALELFLGVVEAQPVTYPLSESELAEFAGSYDAQAQAIELNPQAGGFSVQIHNKGGFPTPETPASPDPQPFNSAFYAADHTILTSGPDKGTRAEFLRGAGGEIEWLRTGGRIHRKNR
jgi:CubicO group peptidase (beta-lactamase class C family)